MEMNSNESLDEKKVDTIKLRLLELETDNIVKKESNPAMVDKIQRMIPTYLSIVVQQKHRIF